jgi:toxin ParE1/3/4
MRPEPRVTLAAKGDILIAVAYYNDQRPDLGYEFLDEVERASWLIRETPMLFTLVEDPIRRMLLRRFPYGIFYVAGTQEEADTIIAVVDLRQDPRTIRRAYERCTGKARTG